MTYQEFFNLYNGKSNVGNTTENKGECVGLSAVWIDALGLPHVWGHAKDLFANADEKFFDKILNTPDAVAQIGDIAVFGISYGKFGHTGVVHKPIDINTLEIFSQNDPLGSNCHLVKYTYKHIIGWLRPKVSHDCEAEKSQLRAERDTNWNLYQNERNAKITQEGVIDQQNKLIAEKQRTINDLESASIQYKDQIEKLTLEKTNAETALQLTKTTLSDTKVELSVCNGLLSNRKDIAKFASSELSAELKTRIDVSWITKLFL